MKNDLRQRGFSQKYSGFTHKQSFKDIFPHSQKAKAVFATFINATAMESI